MQSCPCAGAHAHCSKATSPSWKKAVQKIEPSTCFSISFCYMCQHLASKRKSVETICEVFLRSHFCLFQQHLSNVHCHRAEVWKNFHCTVLRCSPTWSRAPVSVGWLRFAKWKAQGQTETSPVSKWQHLLPFHAFRSSNRKQSIQTFKECCHTSPHILRPFWVYNRVCWRLPLPKPLHCYHLCRLVKGMSLAPYGIQGSINCLLCLKAPIMRWISTPK